MSETYTTIRIRRGPALDGYDRMKGAGWVSYQMHDRQTRAAMIATIRQVQEAMAYDADFLATLSDADFEVEVHRGVHRKTTIEFLE